MIGQNVQNNKYPTEQLYRQMVHTKVGIINKNVFKVKKNTRLETLQERVHDVWNFHGFQGDPEKCFSYCIYTIFNRSKS